MPWADGIMLGRAITISLLHNSRSSLDMIDCAMRLDFQFQDIAKRAPPLSSPMDQKWRTVRTKEVLKDRWINVRADYCVTPAGTEIGPYYVLTYPDWVHVVAVTPAGSLVLVRQYRHAAGDMFLELPGGAIDPSDANIEQAARRELEEETGFSAQHWELVSILYPNPATQTNRVHVYVAIDAVRDRAQRLDEGEEGLQVSTVPIKEVLDRLGTGILGQSMHVSAVLLGLAVAGRLRLENIDSPSQFPGCATE
jgi:8-oxo-dGTP pyrophosphatase MutT (NUDIX family)